MDVHKGSISAVRSEAGQQSPEFLARIDHARRGEAAGAPDVGARRGAAVLQGRPVRLRAAAPCWHCCGCRNRDNYLSDARYADQRLKEWDQELRDQLADWSLGPQAAELRALPGIDWLAATGLLAELGDLRRFDNPPQLMAYIGLVPSENSSGGRRR